jgi:hypothetical protein
VLFVYKRDADAQSALLLVLQAACCWLTGVLHSPALVDVLMSTLTTAAAAAADSQVNAQSAGLHACALLLIELASTHWHAAIHISERLRLRSCAHPALFDLAVALASAAHVHCRQQLLLSKLERERQQH